MSNMSYKGHHFIIAVTNKIAVGIVNHQEPVITPKQSAKTNYKERSIPSNPPTLVFIVNSFFVNE